MGTAVILLTGVGYALSARARAIAWLLVPFLCGKAGRSAMVTASVSLILQGPIENMMTNSKIAVDSFMCLGALSYNHTKERLLLMYKPIKRIIWDFDEQAKVIHNETATIDQEVKPIEAEVSGDGREAKALEADAEYVDKVSDSELRSKLVREKYEELKKEIERDKEIEADYAKKLELRCEGRTILPQRVQIGRSPLLRSAVPPGIPPVLAHETHHLVPPRQQAKGYVEKYLDDLAFDNIYVTEYFCKIDDRRARKGMDTLLPLKRYEAIDIYDPLEFRFSRHEYTALMRGVGSELVHVAFGSIVLGLDYLIYDVLDIIRRNAEVEFVQEGFHRIALQVFGTGAVSNLVRKLFKDFDIEEKLERIASNAHCLPRPVRTSRWLVLRLYLVYASLVALVFAQLFAARMRRAVCAYFFRKVSNRWLTRPKANAAVWRGEV
ncbi:hypothetical protein V5799_028150 [Amblyomma americanum]|uniref:Dendritic cell-specific transmembrane protein-like domain-containing protein n=1 Tax=Amblyomma americanum TaxID=6943 RepID=A0AAQ4DDP8_AMBAM